MSGRFVKGQSGNPAGRPKARRPNISAFDIIFDKTLTVTQGGVARELSVDEVLEMKTYQAALAGSRLAVRKVLKMIEKREVELARRAPQPSNRITSVTEHDADNADAAMQLLGIGDYDPRYIDLDPAHRRFRLHAWAAQAALSRPGRRRLEAGDIEEIRRVTLDADTLKWPRGTRT